MLSRQNLSMRGFVVLSDADDDKVVAHLQSLSRDKDTFWIHDTVGGVVQDEHHFRAFVPDQESRSLSVDL
ncbi:hypothetical protein ON010_g15579 [Phytophthora cinnamomi]|nr:hypothetical protein ON010_g15579 [Phytophthora cinnamomi]